MKDKNIIFTALTSRGFNFLPNFQKGGGGLDRTSVLEGVAGKEGGDFFQGVAIFRQKIN